MVGGGMRQAGSWRRPAVALEPWSNGCRRSPPRGRLAEGLPAIVAEVDPRLVETNIVMVEIGHTGADAKAWMAALRAAGVGAGTWSRNSIRLVTHRHIDDAAVDQALGIVREVAAGIGMGEGRVLERAG